MKILIVLAALIFSAAVSSSDQPPWQIPSRPYDYMDDIHYRYPRNPLPQTCRIAAWGKKPHYGEDLVFAGGRHGKTPPYGTPVTAMESGTAYALASGNGPGCNGTNYVAIQVPGENHWAGPFYTYYYRMTPAAGLKKGDPVHEGQEIGVLDNSGCRARANLHVERKTIKGVSVDISFPCTHERPYYGEAMDSVPDDILEEQ